ncbi:Zinc finger protein 26 [Eumeta japonica]|uniref:Zinc finger protein 26 n=1 Tax=Eumeta variegata TaxID=151549 RepID=A0A4C1VU07_EUMVA|nr:Zinc finger protein 26 [Eumeta japonica]
MPMNHQMHLDDANDTTCGVCYAEFVDPLELERHVHQVHFTKFNKQRFCKLCSEIFPSIVDYSEHIVDTHVHDLIVCPHCSRVFREKADLESHLRKHRSVSRKMFSCSQCSMLFTKCSDLKDHEFEKHEDSGDGFFLQRCYPYISSLLKMGIENYLCAVERGQRLSCSVCTFKSCNPHAYIKHLKKCTARVYICDLCNNLYTRFNSLIGHIQSYTDNTDHIEKSKLSGDELTRCKFCKKAFGSLLIREHMEKCAMVLNCKQCQLTFDSVPSLTAHQTKVHPAAAYIFNCKYCRQDFVGESNLDKHIEKAHKHEMHLFKYKCVHCNDIFKHPSKLFGHFQTRHSWLRPYNCEICKKEFFLRKKFTIHIKMVHKSEGIVKFDDKFNVIFSEEPDILNVINESLMEHDYSLKTGECNNIEEHLGNGDQSASADEVVHSQDIADEIGDIQNASHNCQNISVSVNNKSIGVQESNRKNQNDEIEDALLPNETDNTHVESQIETEHVPSKEKNRKTKRLTKRKIRMRTYSESSEDEPLSKIAKKRKFGYRNKLPRSKVKYIQKRFTCNICKKYCFTFNNYNRHMSSHFKKESKQCVKCAKLFETQDMLDEHLKKEHSTSRLTETLKRLLAKRKMGLKSYTEPLSMAEKIRGTIKKVKLNQNAPKAIMKLINSDMSVRKFLEDFKPDDTDRKENKGIQVRLVMEDEWRKPTIKLIKVDMTPTPLSKKLAMPVKFSKPVSQKQNIEIKLISANSVKRTTLNFGSAIGNSKENESSEDQIIKRSPVICEDNADEYDMDSVPEVSQNEEIDFEPLPEVTDKNIAVDVNYQTLSNLKKLLPDLTNLKSIPSGVKHQEIKIATLLPEAPYYKIIKLKDLQKELTKKEEAKPTDDEEPININLVNVNPLAHLMGDKLPQPQKTSYKPKIQNFQGVIAKALVNLDKPAGKRTKLKSES